MKRPKRPQPELVIPAKAGIHVPSWLTRSIKMLHSLALLLTALCLAWAGTVQAVAPAAASPPWSDAASCRHPEYDAFMD
jgi:hypothetical protein